MKITLSKSQWEKIGKKAGWMSRNASMSPSISNSLRFWTLKKTGQDPVKAERMARDILTKIKQLDKDARLNSDEKRLPQEQLPSDYLINVVLPIDGWDGVIEKIRSGQFLPPQP